MLIALTIFGCVYRFSIGRPWFGRLIGLFLIEVDRSIQHRVIFVNVGNRTIRDRQTRRVMKVRFLVIWVFNLPVGDRFELFPHRRLLIKLINWSECSKRLCCRGRSCWQWLVIASFRLRQLQFHLRIKLNIASSLIKTTCVRGDPQTKLSESYLSIWLDAKSSDDRQHAFFHYF